MSAARLSVLLAGILIACGAVASLPAHAASAAAASAAAAAPTGASAATRDDTVWLRCRASASDVARGGIFPLTCEWEQGSRRLGVRVPSVAETIDPFHGAPAAALPSVAETLDPFAAEDDLGAIEIADPFVDADADDTLADPF